MDLISLVTNSIFLAEECLGL